MKTPVPAARTVLLTNEKPDLGGWRGPAPGSVLRDVHRMGAALAEQLARELQPAGFEPRTQAPSGASCDLSISFRVTRGEARLRPVKGLPGLELYGPAKLTLELSYRHAAAGRLGALQVSLASDAEEEIQRAAKEIAAFTAAKIPRKE